tara:strand:+ start:183 stop:401 length:219 start_codon:yes stop_codon:yes gene_type:complete
MQVGDLVYKLDKWVKCNSWMEDTELDYSDKTKLGIIVKRGSKARLVEVSWFHKDHNTTESIGSLVKFQPDKK